MELHTHIVQSQKGVWYVTVSADRVKNNIGLEHDLPAESGALLERYLHDFRPLLAQPTNAALFPGRGGLGTKSVGTLRGQIIKTIHSYTGLNMHPHLFRHLAGFIHLNEHPGEYLVVSQVLNHRSVNTVMKHYAGMERTAAVRHYDNTVLGVRNDGRPKPRKLGRVARRAGSSNNGGRGNGPVLRPRSAVPNDGVSSW